VNSTRITGEILRRGFEAVKVGMLQKNAMRVWSLVSSMGGFSLDGVIR
jgi:hypothetical protein